MTLGAYPALGLADARTLALDKRHAVDVEGRDPVAEKKAERVTAIPIEAAEPAVSTFADLTRLYETFANSGSTWADDGSKMEKYFLRRGARCRALPRALTTTNYSILSWPRA